jgi:hypothetical protein
MVEQRRAELRVVNEVVGYAVDVPGYADRVKPRMIITKAQRAEKIEHAEEVGAV